MTSQQFTVEDLRRILVASAGAAEGLALGPDTTDETFENLGYDSIALIETGSQIQREFGISLNDSDVMEALTPRELIAVVNTQLTSPTRTSA